MSESLAAGANLGSRSLHAAPIELIQRCLEGEERAYLAVYNEYAAMIFRLCFSILGHEQDAEEVMQDTFEYAFRKLSRYDARRASFKTWLYQIAISRCRNKRRRKVLPTFPLGNVRDEQLPDHKTPRPAERAILSEQQLVVWQALEKLSTKLREVAVLRYYEELTYAEIGNVLSIPPKTAESRMRLAHKQLREHLMNSPRWTGRTP
ncbi:MAG: RNA polymerase sigma factor [Chloroflexota bacterium]|jgi:RNA polymerase sigma-70 factor (ECF subfamily)